MSSIFPRREKERGEERGGRRERGGECFEVQAIISYIKLFAVLNNSSNSFLLSLRDWRTIAPVSLSLTNISSS